MTSRVNLSKLALRPRDGKLVGSSTPNRKRKWIARRRKKLCREKNVGQLHKFEAVSVKSLRGSLDEKKSRSRFLLGKLRKSSGFRFVVAIESFIHFPLPSSYQHLSIMQTKISRLQCRSAKSLESLILVDFN